MIPNAEEFINKNALVFIACPDKVMKEFAIEILKYNLKQYRTQMFQFNTGDATMYKSFDDITLETIKELENGK